VSIIVLVLLDCFAFADLLCLLLQYPDESLKCVVDAKSMLYLYGLELDYSTELIGGGFKFFNPNAEESCGCGSSFGV
jgi:iron-sulfur cluster assembly accessory protein